MTDVTEARQGEGLEDAAWLTILEDLTRSLLGDLAVFTKVSDGRWSLEFDKSNQFG